MKLSKEERETIINFNERDDLAEVYTHNASLKSRLRSLANSNPEVCRIVGKNKFGSASYLVAKRLVHISKPKSEAWKTAVREKAMTRAFKPQVTE